MVASDVIAMSAVVVALASLYVAAQQISLAKKHNRLSVRPFLSIYRKEFQSQPIEYIVANRGIGPAIVTNFQIIVDDKAVAAQDGNAIYVAMDILNIDRSIVGGHLFGINEVLKVGQEIVIMKFPASKIDPTLHKELLGKLPRVKFGVSYESMYQEKYNYEGNG